MDNTPYRELAARLDELPQGFPPTDDAAELRLLARLFTPEEAALAARLRLTLETPAEIAARVGGDPQALRGQLKEMAKRGLITAGRAATGGLGFGVMPFVVGIYEMQAGRIDAELAQLFEDYYQRSYRRSLAQQPPVHRVIPVAQTVRNDMAVHPYESATEIIAGSKAWAVTDCICRKQQALLGQPCEHPVDVCMVFSQTAGAFDQMTGMNAPLPGRGARHAAPRSRGRTGAFGQQQPGRAVVSVQLLYLRLRHPARPGRPGHGQRDRNLGVPLRGGRRQVHRLRGMRRALLVRRVDGGPDRASGLDPLRRLWGLRAGVPAGGALPVPPPGG